MLTAPKKDMTAEDLRSNMLSTYFTLRIGIVILSAALPIGLLAYSAFWHRGLEQHSMSAFYGAYDGAMQNWFVGILWAVGAFLLLYQGFSSAEDWALNLAGAFAILTAITPCDCWTDAASESSWLHAGFAVLFFACMVFVCWRCANDTTTLLPEPDQVKFRRKYRNIAGALALAPVAAIPASYVTTGGLASFQFAIETVAVSVFAYYWYTKTQEFHISSAEKRALQGDVKNVKGRGLVIVKKVIRTE